MQNSNNTNKNDKGQNSKCRISIGIDIRMSGLIDFQQNQNRNCVHESRVKLEVCVIWTNMVTTGPIMSSSHVFTNFESTKSEKSYIPNLLGGFHLVDLIITELKDHMTCFFNCAKFQQNWTTLILDILSSFIL